MAYRVVWSPRAVEDLEAISQCIAPDSEVRSFSGENNSQYKQFLTLPFSGRIVPELGDESIRGWFAFSYRVIYQIEKEIVTVAAIVHGKRLLELN